MNTYSPCTPAHERDRSARATDRAGVRSANSRPVLSPTAPQQSRQFQSDGDFATPRWGVALIMAASRFERLAPLIAAAAILFGVLPPLCMWLAGGVPA